MRGVEVGEPNAGAPGGPRRKEGYLPQTLGYIL